MKRAHRILSMFLSSVLLFSTMGPAFAFASQPADTAITQCKVNDAVNPMGIDTQQPIFSWKMESDVVGQCQTAYQILVSSDPDFSDDEKQVWDSGRVEDSRSVGIEYQGDPLSPMTAYYWYVTVWDKDGQKISSEPASFEMGIFGADAWDGSQWIQVGKPVSLHYTVEADVRVEKGAFGLVFNAVDASNLYMWQLNISDGSTVQLKPHYKKAGTYTVISDHTKDVTWAVEGGFDGIKAADQHFAVEVTETAILTYVNDNLVDTIPLSELSAIGVSWNVEKVGFRSDKNGNESASLDNLTVTDYVSDPEGAVLRSYTFDEGENPLTGGSLRDGRLYTENTAGSELVACETTAPARPALHYVVEADVTCLEAGIGIVFNATDYDNFYMWQFNTANEPGKVLLRPHVWKNGEVTNFDSTSHKVDVTNLVGGVDGFKTEAVHVKIDVTDTAITTYLNDTLADTFPIDQLTGAPAPTAGKIGFRSDHGDHVESGIIDNLTMSSCNSLSDQPTVVYAYDFDDGENPFDVGVVEEGQLYTRNPEDGTWVGLDIEKGTALFRKAFTPEKEIASARVYATALGVYDLYLNGQRVGNKIDGEMVYDELKPYFTQAPVHVMYQTYDVTEMVQAGQNALSANVSSGWWSGNINGTPFGTGTGFRAKLVLTFQDGTRQVVGTDTNWKTTMGGPVVEADIYNGETYDANRSVAWRQADFEDTAWADAMLRSDFTGEIIAQQGPGIRVREDLTLYPKSITVYDGAVDANEQQYGRINVVGTYEDGEVIHLKKGETAIFDFGQNAAGVPEITVQGKAGTTVYMHGGEMLNDNNGLKSRGNDGPEGSIYFANLRTAEATSTYIMSGDPQGETYHSTFTYYGYQYLAVTATEDVDILGMKTLVLTSVEEDTGTISTSNADVNRLFSNIRWSMYSNYVGVPTDCPQRDERLGWSADTQIFSITGSYNADAKAFLERWLLCLRDAQQSDGQYTDVAPCNGFGTGNVGWSDAGIIVPYNLYKMYGDVSVIRDSYDSMTKYMDWLAVNDGPKWNRWGDHLAPGNNNNDDVKKLVAKAYYAWDLQMMAEMADILGKTEDAEKYRQLYEERKALFQADYFVDGVFQPEEQTCCIMALKVDLVPEESREAVAQKLIDNIRAHGNKLQTGFLGTGAIMQTLTDAGAADVAYQLLLQRDYPSWLYSIDQGATTTWERWNSYTKENGFGEVGMNSFNHYAYGVVAEWMYRYMAGIEADMEEPGFKHIILQPTPGGGLSQVTASYDSAYGEIVSNWGYENHDTFVCEAKIPANTTAAVYLPTEGNAIQVNGKDAADLTVETDGIRYVETKDGKAVFEAVAGQFTFKTKVERYYQISVTDGDSRYPSTLLVDGVAQSLPYNQQVKYGDSVTLEFLPINQVDSYFSSVSGDISSTSRCLEISPDRNLSLVINNRAYQHENFALHKPVSTNNEELNLESYGWKTSYLTDGKKVASEGTLGYTSAAMSSANVSGEPMWVEVDLEQNRVFDTITLYPRTDKSIGDEKYAYCFPRDYEIQVRGEGESEYKTVHKVTDQPDFHYYSPISIHLPQTEEARYVRVVATELGHPDGPYRLQFAELTVMNLSSADRSALRAAVESAEALDSADYTAESWEGFTQALTLAEEALQAEYADQTRIDEAAEVLAKAIAELESVGTTIVKGDMDGDGKVDIMDVMSACRILARNNSGSAPLPEELERGDMNGDGFIQINDIMSICRVLAREAQSSAAAA